MVVSTKGFKDGWKTICGFWDVITGCFEGISCETGLWLTRPRGFLLTGPKGFSGFLLIGPKGFSGFLLIGPKGFLLTSPKGFLLTSPKGFWLIGPKGFWLIGPTGFGIIGPKGFSGFLVAGPTGFGIIGPKGFSGLGLTDFAFLAFDFLIGTVLHINFPFFSFTDPGAQLDKLRLAFTFPRGV